MTVYSIWGQSAESIATAAFVGTLATDFSSSSAGALTGIWVYSPSGVTTLPAACAIYDVVSATAVAGTVNSSPSWSGAAGSGWIKCSYGGAVTLNAAQNYAVAVYYNATVAYLLYTWPVTSGIITATASAYDIGGSLTYPETSAGAYTYWVDVELTVTPPPAPTIVYCMRTFP